MSQCSTRPYEGNEDYIFVSCCRADAAQAFSLIERMAADGYRLWFDPDADPASADIEEVAAHLNGAAVVLALLSDEALNDFGCRREINFALLKNKRLIAAYLSPAHLSLGMEMQLATAAVVSKCDHDSEDAFLRQLYEQKGFVQCKSEPAPDAAYDTFSADMLGTGAAFMSEAENEPPTQIFSAQTWEEERLRREEEERLRNEELERLRKEEEERLRREEEERLRKEEEERLRKEEEERLRLEEEERLRKEEEERLRKEEEERLRLEEEERLRKEEEERLRKEEEERLRKEEEERLLKEEEERRVKAELAEKERLAFLAQEAEAERVRKFEAERQRQAAAEPQFIFCSFCGKKLSAKTKYCTGCGSLVVQEKSKSELPFGSAAQIQRIAMPNVTPAQRPAVPQQPFAPPMQQPAPGAVWQLKRLSTGETVGIPLGSFTVGRSETDANYVIKGNSAIGRKHAVFGCSPNGVTVTDLHSLNQTRINGQELLPDVTYQLAEGDVIQFANEQFLLTRARG